MKKAILILALALIAACNGESPTAPSPIIENVVTTPHRKRPVSIRPVPVTPACANPRPLNGKWNSKAPGYIVRYKNGTDSKLTTSMLAAKYGFTPSSVYVFVFPGFSGQLTQEAVAGLRCEPAVEIIEYVSVGGISSITQ